MRRKRELDISQADEQFRANPTFQALVANWHSLSAAEKGRLMQEILRATGRPRTDLARALGMDEANVRHYIRVSAEDSTLNRPVADSPQSVAERSSAKDTQTANKRAPTSTGSISVSAPDPNPIVQNSQLRRMAGTSSQTNSSSIGRQLPYAERPATDQRIPVIIPVRKRMFLHREPINTSQSQLWPCEKRKPRFLRVCRYSDRPNSRRLTFELKLQCRLPQFLDPSPPFPLPRSQKSNISMDTWESGLSSLDPIS